MNTPGPVLMTKVAFAGDIGQLPDTAKVFVYVRTIGTTMPLAVDSFVPADLPLQVGFGHPTGDVDQVEIVARISLTGAVTKQPNDLEVVSDAIDIREFSQLVPLTIAPTPGAAVAYLPPSHPPITTSAGTPSAAQLALSVQLDSKITPAAPARLFIIAKIPNSSMPMPVAVKAFDPRAIPDEIVLTDRDAMTTLTRLSTMPEVEVLARLSQSGQTQRRTGDWESEPAVVTPGDDATTTLVVARRVE